jgi:hypothetical protein
MQLRKYRVNTPMPGVCVTGTSKGFMSIPSGAVLVAMRDRNPDALYVSVQWNSYESLFFPRDLTERSVECEVVPREGAA